ncbi:MAG: GNAT family acetyltransferase [Alphaproteobacteria bacterium]
MDVRNYEDGDRRAVIALWQACGLVVTGKNDPEADIDFAVASADAEILVGVVEDEIAATVMVGHDGHRGWLYYVAVAPARQRRGLGWRMVEEAEAWLRQRGAPKAQLMIRETNTQVEAFYARLGYATIPRIVMQKVL